MRLCARIGGVALRERQQPLLCLAQQLGGRPVDPGDRLVARGAIEIVVLELLQTAPVGLAHRLVGGRELRDKLCRIGIGDAAAQPLRHATHLAFALLERRPMLVQCLRFLAAKQRVLPFLNLLLEVDLDGLDVERVALAGHHVFVEHSKARRVSPEAERCRGDHQDGADCEKQKDPPSHHEQGARVVLIVH